MAATNHRTPRLNGAAQAGADLEEAIRSYVRTYTVLHGRPKAAEAFGVSRHTLWRFLARGHTGRAIPRAVLERVGGSARALDDAKERLIRAARARRLHGGVTVAESAALPHSLSQGLEDALLLLCAAPLATVEELTRFRRVSASTLRDRLGKLAERGLVDSVPHHLGSLGPHPKRRYFPPGRASSPEASSHETTSRMEKSSKRVTPRASIRRRRVSGDERRFPPVSRER